MKSSAHLVPEIRERQMAVARAWLAGFKAYRNGEACPYEYELANVWRIGRLEAEKREGGKL